VTRAHVPRQVQRDFIEGGAGAGHVSARPALLVALHTSGPTCTEVTVAAYNIYPEGQEVEGEGQEVEGEGQEGEGPEGEKAAGRGAAHAAMNAAQRTAAAAMAVR
jgi:hypothetical protein